MMNRSSTHQNSKAAEDRVNDVRVKKKNYVRAWKRFDYLRQGE